MMSSKCETMECFLAAAPPVHRPQVCSLSRCVSLKLGSDHRQSADISMSLLKNLQRATRLWHRTSDFTSLITETNLKARRRCRIDGGLDEGAIAVVHSFTNLDKSYCS